MSGTVRRVTSVPIILSILCGLLMGATLSSRASDPPPAWTMVTSSISPPPMAGAMMAYSSRAERFVLFGGWDGVEGLNGTWVYDPRNVTWTAVHPLTRPTSRGDGMLVYDSVADVFVLFGGWHKEANDTYTRLADTWVFSLANHTWMAQHPVRSPSARSDAQVAYDSHADVVLVFGGFDGTSYLQDIWYYSLRNDNWSPRPSATTPSPRADGRMVYVDSQDRFLVFGGNDFSGPNYTFHHLSDTWSYDWKANDWTPLASAVGPSARDYPVFSVDPNAGLALLTSGFGERIILDDLWGFNLASDMWVNLTPEVSPPARFAAVGGFDPVKDVLVLFSGLANTGLLADTWHYAYGGPVGASAALPLGLAMASAVVLGVVVAIALWSSFKRRRS